MDDQTYWHEGEPRIIASGRWEQDEYGDTSYIPDNIRPSTAPPADPDAAPLGDFGGDLGGERTGADGYRIRSDAVWTAARRDYLAGDAAEAVCARYDLKLGTLRSRAAREGWRRSDVEDVWPDPRDEDPKTPAPDLTQMAAQALMRLNRALQRGRAVEAASWLRTWRTLTDPALLAAATPDSEPKVEPTPDPLSTLEQDLQEVAAVARDAAALSPDDHAGRRAIETRLTALKTRLDPEDRISDDSDELDSVFPVPPSPSRGEGSGMGVGPPPAQD